MSPSLQLIATSNRPLSTATIAMRGAISLTSASRAAQRVRALPDSVRAAHLDLSRVRLYEVGAMNLILDALRAWSRDRGAVVSITSPESWHRGP